MSGKIIFDIAVDSNNIDLYRNDFNQGLYFLKVYDNNNKLINSQLLIVE
jgi:hypothetical protein